MPKTSINASLAAAALLLADGVAHAKEYVDYGYAKGIWSINTIEVDPSHVDDYLTGLRQSQVPGLDILKKRGIIDDYSYSVRQGYTKGVPNVVIAVHYVNAEGLMPNPARDQTIEKEIYASFSEQAAKTAVSGYEKYRQFIDNAVWFDVKFNK